jgi:hypothetical protein
VHRAGHHCTVRTRDIVDDFGNLIRASFVEHCYQEALALIEENNPVLLALAQALIDHPERTLNAAEIDALIPQTLARQALAAEQARRAAWRQVTGLVAETTVNATMATRMHVARARAAIVTALRSGRLPNRTTVDAKITLFGRERNPASRVMCLR